MVGEEAGAPGSSMSMREEDTQVLLEFLMRSAI